MIYAESAIQDRPGAEIYMSGITVNVTTTNDDGSVTYQILSISNETFAKVGEIYG